MEPPAGPRSAVGLSLKGRALKLLSAREHSRAELTQKLAPHAAQPAQLEALLDEFEARGFICAERVVASVVHRRAARLGSSRIRQELLAKGINPADHPDTLAALRASDAERALEVWQRRFGVASDDPRERARQARFLLARGFPGEVVHRVVRGLPDNND
jgi:regulatory protein